MSSSDDNSDDNREIDENMIKDEERTAIRAELSSLSFEELQKLKERIGAKEYNEALFGTKHNKVDSDKPKVFKRENKNRPREMSSKKPVSMVRNPETVQMKDIRDPRFDPLCGDFDKKQFNVDYNFLNDVRIKDIKAIQSELKQCKDPEQEVKLRRLLQRLTEQARAIKRKHIEKQKQHKEREIIQQDLKEGRQHRFMNKSERRVEALVKQYEELKTEGTSRIQRHLKRRQQKVNKRSHRPPTADTYKSTS